MDKINSIYDKSTRFNYFYSVLLELYQIIKRNKDLSYDNYVDRIKYFLINHITYYNNKYGSIRLTIADRDTYLEFYSTIYIYKVGIKKEFKADISILAIMRESLYDQLINDMSIYDVMDSETDDLSNGDIDNINGQIK